MKRSQLLSMPEYFDRYINMNDDVELKDALQISESELIHAPIEKWKALGNKVYAPGKWTVKDLLQHIIDTERVFAYRALAFARGQSKVLPFDEEMFANQAIAIKRNIDDLFNEALNLRKSTIDLFQSFSDEMLMQEGLSFKGTYKVCDIGFIISGHQRWHFKVLEERYYGMMEAI